MKRILLLLVIVLPLSATSQDVGQIPDFSISVRPYYNPTFFKSHESAEVSNTYEYVNIQGCDARFNYSILDLFTAGVGVGVHGFNLRMNNNSFWQRLNDDDVIDDIDYFGQRCVYVTAPMEIGIAPRLFKTGWFEPRLTVSVIPHFKANQDLIVEFNDSTSWSQTKKTSVINNFEGGAREVYTSIDVSTEFRFWIGSFKKAGIGFQFGYSDNLSGPQSYLLRNGRGFHLGFTVSGRF